VELETEGVVNSSPAIGTVRKSPIKMTLVDRVEEANKLNSLRFIEGTFLKSQARHLELAIQNIKLAGPWLEFGVWKGTTARLLMNHLPEGGRLFLFDSFQGLPEDWKPGFPKGEFALPESERPRFDDCSVELVEGFFEDTLPSWVRSHVEPLALLFIDCDLYSSTKTILSCLHPLITPGTVIIFDEYHVPELDSDEMTAFLEYANAHEVSYTYLAKAQNGSVSLIIS
jgi:predicted O-methyltransferase YrrM